MEFQNSANILLNTIEGEVAKCRKGEENVTAEIRNVMSQSMIANIDLPQIADEVLRFLEKKHGNAWLVISMLLEDDNQHLNKEIDFYYSRGFHATVYNGILTAAISVERINASEFSELTESRIKDFRFPVETIKNSTKAPLGLGLSLKPKEEAREIYKHFKRHMAQSTSQNHLGVEFFVVITPCATAGRKAENSAAIAASEGFKWKKITNQDDCANKQVIAIPTRKISPARCPQKSAHLYNVNGHDSAPVYLSVANNLNKEGEYVTLEREGANATGQRWNFVNNQLRNGNNKCLTAWTERSWYLYQYDCHPDWAGQIWIRHGLQIVNGFRFCLTFQGLRDNPVMYATQELCDSTLPFLWFDGDSNCEEPATARVANSISNTSP